MIKLWNDAIRESPAVYKCAESRGVSFYDQKHHRPMEFLHTLQPCIKYLKGMWKELGRKCQSNISCEEELLPIAESILLLHSFHHKCTDASCSVYESYKPLDVFFVLNALVSSDEYLRAPLSNFHLRPCRIKKSKIAKLCHNKGLPKPFLEKYVLVCFDNYFTWTATFLV